MLPIKTFTALITVDNIDHVERIKIIIQIQFEGINCSIILKVNAQNVYFYIVKQVTEKIANTLLIH